MVRWSKPAKRDLRKIFEFIAIDSRYYAQKVSKDIVDKSKTLNQFPRMGRIVPEIGDEEIRELSIYSYRLIYQISGNHVNVLALVHERQNFSPGTTFFTE